MYVTSTYCMVYVVLPLLMYTVGQIEADLYFIPFFYPWPSYCEVLPGHIVTSEQLFH